MQSRQKPRNYNVIFYYTTTREREPLSSVLSTLRPDCSNCTVDNIFYLHLSILFGMYPWLIAYPTSAALPAIPAVSLSAPFKVIDAPRLSPNAFLDTMDNPATPAVTRAALYKSLITSFFS